MNFNCDSFKTWTYLVRLTKEHTAGSSIRLRGAIYSSHLLLWIPFPSLLITPPCVLLYLHLSLTRTFKYFPFLLPLTLPLLRLDSLEDCYKLLPISGDRPLDAVITDEQRDGPRWLCDDDDDDISSSSGVCDGAQADIEFGAIET